MAKSKEGMTPDELYRYITSKMTPEVALRRLLGYQIYQYENLKKNKPIDGDGVNPIFIITAAALDAGWDLMIENGDKDIEVRGLVVGTGEYLKDLFT